MRPIVAMCCFCEHVRDDTGTEPDGSNPDHTAHRLWG
jgi:hypothetical protein